VNLLGQRLAFFHGIDANPIHTVLEKLNVELALKKPPDLSIASRVKLARNPDACNRKPMVANNEEKRSFPLGRRETFRLSPVSPARAIRRDCISLACRGSTFQGQ
jgi:hypothetical protein